jgi:hypothetical protein
VSAFDPFLPLGVFAKRRIVMNLWNVLWLFLVSVACLLGMRNALGIYRHPREVRTSVSSLEPQQARRAALAALFGFPVIWFLIALETLRSA